MPQKALIIVDMLNDFIDEKGALYCGSQARKIIPFVRDRLSTFRKNDDLVVYLQDSHAENDLEFTKFPKHCVTDTWGSEIIHEISPVLEEKIITKTRYSGFYGTDLDKILEEANPKEVEVVGVCTSICVMDTVGGLANRDYNVLVPAKGVADFDNTMHDFSLKRMKQVYGARVT